MQTTQTTIERGTNVYGSDGEKVGDVSEVQNDYFVIEKGFIFTTDLYIPTSMVHSQDADGLHLSLSKDEIEKGDWSSVPVLSDQDAPGPVGYAGQHTDADSAPTTGARDARYVEETKTDDMRRPDDDDAIRL